MIPAATGSPPRNKNGEGGTNRKLVLPQFKTPTSEFSFNSRHQVKDDLLSAAVLTKLLREVGFKATVVEVDPGNVVGQIGSA
ncbi:MAG: hypothetical protein NT159_05795 [Proteobacteria bacterium]|nr:hypothetical protein [Pseudomonadota bacterium]